LNYIDRTTDFWFFQGPLIVLLITNIVYFFIVLVRVCKLMRQTTEVMDTEANAAQNPKDVNQK